MEDPTEFTLTAAVTTEVPTFYEAPAPKAEPDTFVFEPSIDEPTSIEALPVLSAIPADAPAEPDGLASNEPAAWEYNVTDLMWYGDKAYHFPHGVAEEYTGGEIFPLNG